MLQHVAAFTTYRPPRALGHQPNANISTLGPQYLQQVQNKFLWMWRWTPKCLKVEMDASSCQCRAILLPVLKAFSVENEPSTSNSRTFPGRRKERHDIKKSKKFCVSMILFSRLAADANMSSSGFHQIDNCCAGVPVRSAISSERQPTVKDAWKTCASGTKHF